jgi:hypothetical protein
VDCRPVQRATDHTQLRRVLNQPGNSKKAPPALVRIVELTNAGHYPLEEPGLSELTEAVANFMASVTI